MSKHLATVERKKSLLPGSNLRQNQTQDGHLPRPIGFKIFKMKCSSAENACALPARAHVCIYNSSKLWFCLWTIFYFLISMAEIYILCSSVLDWLAVLMSCQRVVLIRQTLLKKANPISDQNILARRDAQICQLYCVPARERWNWDGLSHM